MFAEGLLSLPYKNKFYSKKSIIKYIPFTNIITFSEILNLYHYLSRCFSDDLWHLQCNAGAMDYHRPLTSARAHLALDELDELQIAAWRSRLS